MPINRDGDGPSLRREDTKSPSPRADDLRATPFTDDVFDDDYYGRRRARSSPWGLIAAVVIGAVVAASIGWYVLGTRESSMVTDGSGNSKLVKADPTPYKVKPDDPGGMQVDNQDKLVYERLDKGAPAKRVENLLPEPEQPKAPPLKKADAPADASAPQATNSAQATATASDDPLAKLVAKVEGVKDALVGNQPMTPAAPTAQPTPQAPAPMTPVAPVAAPPQVEQKVAALPPDPTPAPSAPVEAAPSAPPPAPAPPPQAQAPAPAVAAPPSAGQPIQLLPRQAETAAPVAEASPPPARIEPAPTAVATAMPAPAPKPFVDPSIPKATPPAATPGQGTMYLQLTSALTEDGAMSDWKRISGKNSDVLGNLSPSVLPADLGDKGMRYRLRAGPMDKASADSLCATLRSRSVDCLVRP